MEFRELLQEMDIDVPTVMARFCNNEALLQRFIGKFPTEKTFGELNGAYQEQRYEDAERAVHTLKGITANLGFEKLYANCVTMLDDLRGSREKLDENYANICKEYQRLIDCINCYMQL